MVWRNLSTLGAWSWLCGVERHCKNIVQETQRGSFEGMLIISAIFWLMKSMTCFFFLFPVTIAHCPPCVVGGIHFSWEIGFHYGSYVAPKWNGSFKIRLFYPLVTKFDVIEASFY